MNRLIPPLPLLALLPLLLAPTSASAQLGAVEAFARRVTDLSFYVGGGGLLGASEDLTSDDIGMMSFGVELLFEVAEITRPVEGAAPAPPADSVRRVWTGMEVIVTEEGVDTVYRYEIEPVEPPPPPREAVWIMEVGIGYGQIQGFDLENPSLEMNGSVRNLPAVTLYASYEPWGNYFGFRTGFMKTEALQVVDGDGNTFSGESESFLLAGIVGYAWSVSDLWFFAEAGYSFRSFPSVEWRGGPLPPGVPLELDLSGWSISTGLQFPIQ